ncbi:MAG: type II toxin-antitoxin system VapC family toxin [Pseudomonadales bacterium]|jgi:PIN domain nuclease of toxin-antitoxin system|nr:type II toxin-antitoxin system VapC family toxin [Pseudomonadales bacterium]
MNCLLDTHTFLWTVFAPDKLSALARATIRSAENRVCISTISFWELSLKYALGKIELENCQPDDMPALAAQMNIDIIQPTAQEAATFHRLPKLAHKAPFDRMIIWQAIQQSLTLISKDAGFPQYQKSGLHVLW